ncbi:Ig-like domain-containing protein [Verrucomicrobiota bacterium sgz303538]
MNRVPFFRGLALLGSIVTAMSLAAPWEADAANIIYLRDAVSSTDQLATALIESGHSLTEAASVDEFGKQLSSGSFELGVLEIQSSDPQEYASAITALQTFVANGGKAVYSEWSGKSSFSAPFGATFTSVKNQPEVVIEDPALRSDAGTPETFRLRNTGWFQFSSGLAPAGSGAVTAASYANGDAAIVFGNQRRSVVFGYRSDAPATGEVYRRTLSSLLNPAATYPKVETGPAVAVTLTSARLTATVNPHGLPTTVAFEYAANGGASIVTTTQEIGSGSNNVHVDAALTGLTSYTRYTFRVRATNSVGMTSGSEGAFTTNSAPQSVPDTVRVDSSPGPIVVRLLENDHDADSDPVTLTAFGDALRGTVVNNGDGTVTYTPGPTFAGLDSFTYEISDGHGGAATALVTLLRDTEKLNGRYQQLLTSNSGTIDGLLQINVSTNGAFTGTLWFQGKRFPVKGVLKLGKTKVLVKARKGAPPLTLQLELLRENDRSRLIGSLNDGSSSWSFNVGRIAYDRANLPPEARQHYTMVFEANLASDPDYGHGWAIFNVAASGAARLSGQLGDGAPFSTTTFITPDARMPLYIVPPKKTSSTIAGTLILHDELVSAETGTLTWMRMSDDNGPTPQLEVIDLPVRGSRYKAPARGQLALQFSPEMPPFGDISLTGEPLPAPFSRLLSIRSGFTTRVENPGDERLSVQVQQSSGRVLGTLRYSGKLILRINGVVLQKANEAVGNVGANGEYGSFTLTPQ